MGFSDLWGDAKRAAAILTRIPVQADFSARTAQAAWAYPLIGAVLGGAGAALAWGLGALGLPAGLCAGAVLALWIILSGAMHEDGLADTADGFWGGWTQERRLDIMRDSRIGTYGVLALILSVGFRWWAVAMVLDTQLGALVLIPAISRAAMPALMHALPPARRDGLAHRTGQPPLGPVAVAVGLGLILALLLSPLALVAVLAPLACAAIARAKIGGYTGDVLGATQQITEIALWLICATVLGA